MPIFLFGILSVVYLLQIIGIQEHLQQAITKLGLETSKYSFVYQYIVEDSDVLGTESEETKQSSTEAMVAKGIDSIYFKARLTQYVDENRINNSCIKGGMSGIHTFMSSFMREGEDIDIIISYLVKIPVPMIYIKEIPFFQRVRVRGFHGYTPVDNKTGSDQEEEEGEATYVYITETGRVYHLTKECSHLKLTIEEAAYLNIDHLRNDAGGKYYPCSICIHKSDKGSHEFVYISKFGDRYHSNLSCSGLKRTIITITLDQVEGKSLCTRCGKSKVN